jgi:hypothetical protein
VWSILSGFNTGIKRECTGQTEAGSACVRVFQLAGLQFRAIPALATFRDGDGFSE